MIDEVEMDEGTRLKWVLLLLRPNINAFVCVDVWMGMKSLIKTKTATIFFFYCSYVCLPRLAGLLLLSAADEEPPLVGAEDFRVTDFLEASFLSEL